MAMAKGFTIGVLFAARNGSEFTPERKRRPGAVMAQSAAELDEKSRCTAGHELSPGGGAEVTSLTY
jgi:hypothetical protein